MSMFMLTEINFSQYLRYLPVPTIDLNDCNSTKHYAGFITADEICAGFTDAEKSPCYVSIVNMKTLIYTYITGISL